MPGKYQVGSYYFPNYHVDPRNTRVHGEGWTEWQLVRHSAPRFPGHRQPRVPQWGYLDEAKPDVMQAKVTVAADHGIDYWIFDWYWYDDGPFLERCLELGYLAAPNNDRVKFCCMWANHDWADIHPAKMNSPAPPLYPGRVTPGTFEHMTDYIVARYFSHPAYFTIDGCPYFSIYDLSKLVASFGGLGETRIALQRFRAKTSAAGHSGLHLNAVLWGEPVVPGQSMPADPVELAAQLGFDSATSYGWVPHVPLGPAPTTDYAAAREAYFTYWDRIARQSTLPYYPNVTVGWDSSPRTVATDIWAPGEYPYTSVLTGNTPAAFRQSLEMTRARLEAAGGPWTLNINCWNEWTEGSYLEPDTVDGMGYLEAVREVFRA